MDRPQFQEIVYADSVCLKAAQEANRAHDLMVETSEPRYQEEFDYWQAIRRKRIAELREEHGFR